MIHDGRATGSEQYPARPDFHICAVNSDRVIEKVNGLGLGLPQDKTPGMMGEDVH
jgi:hypothetical protein